MLTDENGETLGDMSSKDNFFVATVISEYVLPYSRHRLF
jgi:hypothetical protein